MIDCGANMGEEGGRGKLWETKDGEASMGDEGERGKLWEMAAGGDSAHWKEYCRFGSVSHIHL
jgi:hypothetical protein